MYVFRLDKFCFKVGIVYVVGIGSLASGSSLGARPTF